MSRESHRFSDVLPGGSAEFAGEFDLNGTLSVHHDEASRGSDLQRSEYRLRSDFGSAAYTMMGREHFFAEWGSYAYDPGLAYTASTDQPVIGLFLQLEGRLCAAGSPVGPEFDMGPGDANLAVLPPLSGKFEMGEACRGSSFSIMLSGSYFTGLCERYPHLLEDMRERMRREEPVLLRRDHLRVTPSMWAVTQRIRSYDVRSGAGALFLEAQILELLAHQLTQLERPVAPRRASLTRADQERIRAARDFLLARMDDPPSLAEVARYALVNEFKLKRGFREIFGTSPYAYLLRYRLEAARAYLLDTEMTVAEIARRVGYREASHLTHAFQKQYGIRPSDLRRNGSRPARS